ncbi:MAG: B12-binding domain-containing radical SAM protein [Candidatus Omnitrophica bacterium CG11_big_fil_rev_8_21_14_0_20_42_13]|uniref:B12-binding domain-containing radical SAM protein n=1 Tax=Candidatus Ghiorseimicrobium undicola TaxID=1974746 RepID=A0A2H0LYA3_9BACT|nr:MAG: B12-binding domain-containing radical SAM protein [Candidatus Omnitrophica bacterium CG11_big_fil_rev_8_21_14_0_20_42_13]
MKVLLIAYDNGSYISWFPHGLAYIAAAVKNAGHEVAIYNQDKFHYPDEHLTDFLNKNKFDVAGVGVIAGYYQYRQLLKIARAVNNTKHRPYFIIGGHGPSPEPEYFLKKTNADAAVIGEGDATIVELLEALNKRRDLGSVKGVAFCDKGKVVINPRRELIKDIDSLPFPAFELFPLDYYRLLRAPHADNRDFVMPVVSGRGCPFKCTFCYRMDEGFRPRKPEAIIEEIEFLKNKYRITYVIFSDELLMSSSKRVTDICEAFLKAGLNIKWCCNGRLNFALPKVLGLMKKAGCLFINYGIESMDDNVLKNMKKGLTAEMIVKGIEATLASGISPGFNMIFGNIGDTKKTLKKAVRFLVKYDDCSQLRTIRPVTPYPGSPLYYHAIKNGLLKDCGDFYENKHVNSDLVSVNFTQMSDSEFHKCLLEANTELLNNYFKKKSGERINEAKSLYLGRNVNFRGFRQT